MSHYKSERGKAWRNILVAAINEGLKQKLFALNPDGEPKDSKVLEFSILGHPAIASFRECGFDEISVHVIWKPTEEGKKFVRVGGIYKHRSLGPAIAEAWLERRNGPWIQSHGRQPGTLFSVAAAEKAALAAMAVRPAGYFDHGRFFL